MAQLPLEDPAPMRRQAPPLNYQQLLADRTLDAVRDNPQAFLAGYCFTNEAPAPAALLDQSVLLSDRQPLTFLCLVPRGEMYTVQILHRFMRYVELPGERPTGFHDRVLALLGDVRPGQFPVVEVPPTTFHLAATAAVRIPTHATMVAAGLPLRNKGGRNLLGPYPEGVAEERTELVCPRHIQLVPSQYVLDLIGSDGVHPRQAYQSLTAAMEADGTFDNCRDVLTWLRTASTARGGGGAQAAVPAVSLVFPGVHLPQAVYQYVASKIHGDLPALRTGHGYGGDVGGLGGIAPPAQQVAELMRLLAEGRAPRRDEGEPTTREPKLVQDVYRETYLSLLRYSRVERTG